MDSTSLEEEKGTILLPAEEYAHRDEVRFEGFGELRGELPQIWQTDVEEFLMKGGAAKERSGGIIGSGDLSLMDHSLERVLDTGQSSFHLVLRSTLLRALYLKPSPNRHGLYMKTQ